MQYIQSISDAVSALGELSKYPSLQCDTETYLPNGYIQCAYNMKAINNSKVKFQPMAVDPHTSEIRLIQLGTPDNKQYIFDTYHVPIMVLKDFLESGVELIGHNIGFDLKMFLRYGIKPKRVYDTMVALQVLEAGSGIIGHGLKDALERVLNVQVDKTEQSSDWGVYDLSLSQLTYAASDVAYLHRLKDEIHNACVFSGLENVIALEMAVTPVLAWMEFQGVAVDIPQTMALMDKFAIDMAIPLAKAAEIVGSSKFNPRSPQQVIQAFQAFGVDPLHPLTKKPSSDKETLQNINHPLAVEILKYREYATIISNFLTKFPKLIHPVTGRMHTSYTQAFTDTGRLSSREPNLQNVPTRTEIGAMIRGLFPAPEDILMNLCDYSQIEIRLLAMMSKDPYMTQIIKEGADLHDATTEYIFNTKKKKEGEDGYDLWKRQRYTGKTTNFAIGYGITALNLAAKSEGLLTEKQAQRVIDKWFEMYGGVKGLYDANWQHVLNSKPHESRTLLGRRRLYNFYRASKNEVQRQANNHIIQGSAADIMKAALVEIYRSGLDIRLNVHDEAIVYSKPENAEHERLLLEQAMIRGAKRVMENSIYDIDQEVPIIAEAATIGSWKEK